MKKFLVTVIMFASLGAFSQISLAAKKIQRLGVIEGAYIERVEDKYEVNFKDMSSEGNELVKFTFRAGKTTDFDDIRNLILTNFETAITDDVLKINSGSKIIGMKYVKQNGIRVVQFFLYPGGNSIQSSRSFTIEEIDELFTK